MSYHHGHREVGIRLVCGEEAGGGGGQEWGGGSQSGKKVVAVVSRLRGCGCLDGKWLKQEGLAVNQTPVH